MPAAAASPVVIKLWDHHVHDKKFRKEIFKSFNQANPDIRVDYTSQVSGTYETILAASYNSGDLPDIFIAMGAVSLPKLFEMGWVMPLDNVAPSKEEFQKWQALFPQEQRPFVNEINMFGGKVYSWPISGFTGWQMLFYNTTLFTNAGLKSADGQAKAPRHGMTCASPRKSSPSWARARSTASSTVSKAATGSTISVRVSPWLRGGRSAAWISGTGHYDFHSWSLRAPSSSAGHEKGRQHIPGDLSMDDEQASTSSRRTSPA